MNQQQIRELFKKKSNKFNAVNEYGFPSKLARSVYQILQIRARNTQVKERISDIRREQRVLLTKAEISWACDYTFRDSVGGLVWCEAKGAETERFRIIKKLWRVYGPGPLEIWKGDYRDPYLDELIIPKGGD